MGAPISHRPSPAAASPKSHGGNGEPLPKCPMGDSDGLGAVPPRKFGGFQHSGAVQPRVWGGMEQEGGMAAHPIPVHPDVTAQFWGTRTWGHLVSLKARGHLDGISPPLAQPGASNHPNRAGEGTPSLAALTWGFRAARAVSICCFLRKKLNLAAWKVFFGRLGGIVATRNGRGNGWSRAGKSISIPLRASSSVCPVPLSRFLFCWDFVSPEGFWGVLPQFP